MPIVPATPFSVEMSAADLIASAMRLIGVLASGELPSNAEAQDALMNLNQLLDSWSADRLCVFTITISEFPLIVTQQVYTLGGGGDFDVSRPARIDRASIVSLTNPAQPLELPIELYTDNDWRGIPVKNITSTLPQGVYDDGGFPLRNLSYWPIPTMAVNTRLYYWTLLSFFDDLPTKRSFPPGYIKALRFNLAVDLAPEFGREAPASVILQAIESKAQIRSMNVPIIEAQVDDALVGRGGRYNYISDMPVGGRN